MVCATALLVSLTGCKVRSLSYLKLLYTAAAGGQCSAENLPREFDDADGAPNHDQFLAIVPDYRIQCSGKVTEWRACAQPAMAKRDQYYIQFQV